MNHVYSNLQNWAQRMGGSAVKDKDLKGENISTVGVDISDLVLQKGGREVLFSTWDFGGQREYYATHQYFLSKRSLYLLLWKVTDGVRGVHEILQWLVNIQARAPNSPVIIVGTHLDMITKKKYPPNYLPELQRLIVEKYMNHTEPEKSGLPRVVGRIEISCRSSFMFNNHIGDLVNLIWEAVWEEQLPGNKGVKLLDQKVPATYVHLQEVIRILAEERKQEGKDPVLHAEQYKPLVIQKMEEMYSTSFRDVTELSQATQFLHENGIMRTSDLKILFKNAAFKPEDIKAYIIDLLSKFEVALRWDDENLLIPSLLPSELAMLHRLPGTDVRIPMHRPHFSTTAPIHSHLESEHGKSDSSSNHVSSSVTNNRQGGHESSQVDNAKCDLITKGQDVPSQRRSPINQMSARLSHQSVVTSHPNPAVAIVRLYLMAYFPSGFWPRLITRLLGDESIFSIAIQLYNFASLADKCENFWRLLRQARPEWRCWQTGLELCYLGVALMRIREVSREAPNVFCDYRQCSLVIKQDHDIDWHALNLQNTSILEIIIMNETVSVYCNTSDGCCATGVDRKSRSLTGKLKKVDIQPSSQIVAAMLAKLVDHIDTLLEDWYPDLGARFIQNARGMYLITRIVPCTRCLLHQIEIQSQELGNVEPWSMVEVSKVDDRATISQPVRNKCDDHITNKKAENESRPGGSPVFMDGVGGTAIVHQETSAPPEGRTGAMDKERNSCNSHTCKKGIRTGGNKPNLIYCYLTEQCLQAAQMNKIVYCIEHANLGPYFIASTSGQIMAAHVAPDSVFQDIGDHYLVNEDSVTRGHFLGRGAFGAVYAGIMIDKVPLV
ncbi:hypothetical protein LSH36_9g14010 [Paralvinella palmiformis]|uniref:Roc domain-containing protein n=1 Tax=Paralvinella palmiformis TaxID=53620 RepID=A0AAD9KD63_9ANNE|nr:hypothetical protein LSH36_9g14010 [Paralvinella palmiformis]